MKEKINIKKSIIYNSIGTFTYLFCQWLITFIVVWIAGYKEAGILSLAMSITNTFSVIATFNMRNFQSSDLKKTYSERTYLTSRILTSSVSFIILIIYNIINKFSIFQMLCTITYMLYKLSEAFVDVIHGSLQKKWRFDIIGLSYFIRGIITIVIFSLILFLTNNLLISLITMTICIYIFVFIFDVKKYKYEYRELGNTNKKYIVSLLLKCLPLVMYGLLFNYNSMFVKVFAEQLYGETTFGFYSTVSTPALIIQAAASFVFTPLLSLFAELYNEHKINEFNKKMWKVISLIIVLGSLGLLASYFLADTVFELIFGKEILSYTYLFNGVLILSTLTAIIWFLGMLLTITRKYTALILGTILSLIFTILTTKFFVNNYNLNGINITLIISYLIQSLIYHLSLISKKKGDNKNSVFYIRSTSIINDSRASKEIISLINNKFNVTVLGWDRDKRIKDYKDIKINDTKVKMVFFKFDSEYGKSKRTILGLLLFQIWLLFKLIVNNRKYEVIHACDFDCGYISLIVSKLFNKKLVYDMYDYYTDSRPLPVKIEKLVNKMENSIINNANVSIICGEWRTKQISKSHPKKLIVIHNTPDIGKITKKSVIKSNSKKIKIAYVGILQENRLILEILSEIKGSDKYELHIGGFGIFEKNIKEITKKYKNIYYYGSLPYNDVLSLESDCDILFATYDPKIKNHKYSAPNKVYEAMALGKPIIVCKNTGIDELVVDNNIGFAIKYDAKDFVEKLDLLFKDSRKISKMKEASSKMYKEKYNWTIMESRLIEAYKELLKEEKL
mgnify:CR=1 FL=1